MVVMGHDLLSLDIVGTFSIFINTPSFVTSTSSETAAAGDKNQRKCLKQRIIKQMQIVSLDRCCIIM
jgi:hypothetical protein